jgi:Zn finger protein HypA/HybF involved in hydrogenase expression
MPITVENTLVNLPKVTVFRQCRECGSGLPEGRMDVYCESCADAFELPELEGDYGDTV